VIAIACIRTHLPPSVFGVDEADLPAVADAILQLLDEADFKARADALAARLRGW
jgi:hypothetical protein